MDQLDQIISDQMHSVYDDIYERAGKKYNLSPKFLKAQNMQEVGPFGGTNTQGPLYQGLGQLGPAYRKKYGVTDPKNPEQTIMAQAAVVRELLDKHQGDPTKALTEYIGGPDKSKYGEQTAEYPGKIAGYLKGLGGDFSNISYAGAKPQPDQLDNIISDSFKPEEPKSTARAVALPSWDTGDDFWNSALVGGGIPARAAGNALGKFITNLKNGVPLADAQTAFGHDYSWSKSRLGEAREQYKNDNPGTGLFNDLVGAAPATAATIEGGNALALAPLGRQIAALGPKAEAVVNFLGGQVERAPGIANALARRASQALTGAFSGAEAGAIQSPLNPDTSVGNQMLTGAEGGAVLNPLIHAGFDKLASAITPETARAVQGLHDLGVDIRGGQVPGAHAGLALTDRLNQDMNALQREQISNAAGRTFGAPAGPLTRDAMAAHEATLNSVFENWGNKVEVDKDQHLLGDMGGILNNVSAFANDADEKSLHEIMNKIASGGPTISGKDLLLLTKRNGPIDTLVRSPTVGEHAIDLKDALMGALERSAARSQGQWVPAGARASAPAGPITSPAGLLTSAPNALRLGAPHAPEPMQNNLLGSGSDSISGQGFSMRPGEPAPPPLIPQPRSNSTDLAPFGLGQRGGFQTDFGRGVSNPAEGMRGGVPRTAREALEAEVMADKAGKAAPGLVWEINPTMHNVVSELRDARAQWKALQTIKPTVDPVTGLVNHGQLATRVARLYKNSSRNVATPQENDLLALANARQFVPPAPGKPGPEGGHWPSRAGEITDIAVGAGLGDVLGKPVLDMLMHDSPKAVAMMAGALAMRGTAKGVARHLNGPLNSRRLIQNALSQQESDNQPYANLLMAPAIQAMNMGGQ